MHYGEAVGHGVEIDEKLVAKYPYQRAYLPVNRLQHEGTLWCPGNKVYFRPLAHIDRA